MTPKPVNKTQWDRHTLLVEIFFILFPGYVGRNYI
jgi:hypothetical protein